MMRTVFQIYLGFLRSSQSETLQKHVFGAWRAFIKKVGRILISSSLIKEHNKNLQHCGGTNYKNITYKISTAFIKVKQHLIHLKKICR